MFSWVLSLPAAYRSEPQVNHRYHGGGQRDPEAPLNVTFLDPLSHGLGTQYLPFSLKISFVHVHMTSLVYGVQGCMCGHALRGTLAGCTA